MAVPFRTYAAILVFGLVGSFQIGFHPTVYNQLQSVMEKFVKDSLAYQFGESSSTEQYVTMVWTMVISSHAVGALVSGFFLEQLLDDCGRKNTFYMATLLNLVGSGLQASSYFLNLCVLLIPGRFLCGIACCVGSLDNQVFFSEICPTEIRGASGAISHVVAVLAMMLTNILGFPSILGTPDLWPYVFLTNICILLVFLALAWKFPESPKHLMVNENQPERALESLAFYNSSDSDVKVLLGNISAEIRGMDFPTSKIRILNFPRFLKAHKNFLWPTLVANLLNFALAFSGHFLILNFAVYILSNTGVGEEGSRYTSLGYCFMELLSSFFGVWLIERGGRRPMALSGAWITLGCISTIFICQTITESSTMIVVDERVLNVLSICAMLIHSSGKAFIASVLYVITSELFPTNIRSSSAPYNTTFPLMIGNIIVSLGYLPLDRGLGSFALLILLIIPMFVITCVLTAICPETKGRDVSDIVHKTVNKESEKEDLYHFQREQIKVPEWGVMKE